MVEKYMLDGNRTTQCEGSGFTIRARPAAIYKQKHQVSDWDLLQVNVPHRRVAPSSSVQKRQNCDAQIRGTEIYETASKPKAIQGSRKPDSKGFRYQELVPPGSPHEAWVQLSRHETYLT